MLVIVFDVRTRGEPYNNKNSRMREHFHYACKGGGRYLFPRAVYLRSPVNHDTKDDITTPRRTSGDMMASGRARANCSWMSRISRTYKYKDTNDCKVHVSQKEHTKETWKTADPQRLMADPDLRR